MEIVKNGVCLQEKVLNEKCAICGEKLVLGVYRHQSARLKKVIRCKKCNTAVWIKK